MIDGDSACVQLVLGVRGRMFVKRHVYDLGMIYDLFRYAKRLPSQSENLNTRYHWTSNR